MPGDSEQDENTMSDMSNLQQTVEAAQNAHARANGQHTRSRKHLMSVINILEEHVREKWAELSRNDAQRKRIIQEYKKLRIMQDTLVMAVEVGDADGLASLPAVSGAEPETRQHMPPLNLDSMQNGHAPALNGSSQNQPFKNGRDESEDVRNGLRRVLRKTRPQIAGARETEESASAI